MKGHVWSSGSRIELSSRELTGVIHVRGLDGSLSYEAA